MGEPEFCRAEAFAAFRRGVESLDTTDGLLLAASAVALHALPDSDPAATDRYLSELAERVRSRARSGSTEALLAHLHDVLFAEEQFQGNTDQYYLPENSYLPEVIRTKRGLPILIALIYKVVGERAGLQIDGINSPGHFLVQVAGDPEPMIVDPFFHGQVLNKDEAFERLERISGRPIPHEERYLSVATHPEWIARMLTNLQGLFANDGRREDLAAMTELQEELGGSLF